MTNTEPPSKKPPLKATLKKTAFIVSRVVVAGTTLFLCVLSLLTLFGDSSRNLELLTHFKLHLLVSLVATIPFVFLIRQPWLMIPVALSSAINLIDIAPLYFPVEKSVSGPTIKLVSLNINRLNLDPEPILKVLKDKDPDLVCLQELTPEMAAKLVESLPRYKYNFLNPEEGYFGLGTLSKVPIEEPSAQKLSDAYILTQFFNVKLAGTKIEFVNTHPIAPLNDALYRTRNLQFTNLAKHAREVTAPLIVAGDLNSTSYSPCFKKLLKQGNLKDSQPGFGIQPTWSAKAWPLNAPADNFLFGLPLDHFLYRGKMRVVERSALGSVNSDHFPLYIKLCFPGVSP